MSFADAIVILPKRFSVAAPPDGEVLVRVTAVLCGVPQPRTGPGVLRLPDQHSSHCAHCGDSHKMKQKA